MRVVFEDDKNVVTSLGTGYLSKVRANSKKVFEVNFGCSDISYDPKTYAKYSISIDDARGPWRLLKR